MGAEEYECWGESGKIFTTWKGGRGCCFGKDVEEGGGWAPDLSILETIS